MKENVKINEIPNYYFPRYCEIVSTYRNSLTFTPIGRFKHYLNVFPKRIFSIPFIFFMVLNLTLFAPVLIKFPKSNATELYFVCLAVGYIPSYIVVKLYQDIFKNVSSEDQVAQKLGYINQWQPLKPYDHNMLREILWQNNIALNDDNIVFHEMLSILQGHLHLMPHIKYTKTRKVNNYLQVVK